MAKPTSRPDDMTVSAFLAVLAPEVRHVVAAVRKLIRAAAPKATETVLWGSLSYHLPMLGGRVKGAVCQITPRRGHVDVGFIHGVFLPDPNQVLQGTGKSKRHVQVEHVKDLPALRLAELIRSAVEIRPDPLISGPRDVRGRPTTRCS
jgi:hypothetical protein